MKRVCEHSFVSFLNQLFASTTAWLEEEEVVKDMQIRER